MLFIIIRRLYGGHKAQNAQGMVTYETTFLTYESDTRNRRSPKYHSVQIPLNSAIEIPIGYDKMPIMTYRTFQIRDNSLNLRDNVLFVFYR